MRKTIVAAGATALTLALAAFSGTALAGGGHGAGQGGSSPGNSGNAQGHSRQSRSSQQTSTVQTGGDNSQGTKPSSTTAHNTYATAGSGHTKRYGNGKTAGRIAERNGASPDTVLHGPGNSQPHKAALCPGGHERDVHALKGGSANCTKTAQVKTQTTMPTTKTAPAPMIFICHATGSASNPYVLIHVSSNSEAAHAAHQGGRDIILGSSAGSGCPQPTPAAVAPKAAVVTSTVPVTSTVSPKAAVAATSTVQATTTVTTTTTATTSGVLGASTSTTSPAAVLAAPPTTTAPTGGVLGAQATLKPRPRPSSGVLGTVGSTTLPFTGLPLWPFALGALALIGAGAAVRRTQRGTP